MTDNMTDILMNLRYVAAGLVLLWLTLRKKKKEPIFMLAPDDFRGEVCVRGVLIPELAGGKKWVNISRWDGRVTGLSWRALAKDASPELFCKGRKLHFEDCTYYRFRCDQPLVEFYLLIEDGQWLLGWPPEWNPSPKAA
jgi:hypothetical protein